MPNEMFTQLPTVPSAQLSDIICAVQGYVSPSSPGTSVQETLSQVLSLIQSNVVLSNAGNPNGAVAGVLNQLCWDTTNLILYICVLAGTSATAQWKKTIQLTAGTGITISQSGNNITINASGSGVTWNDVTGGSAAMVSENGYVADSAGLTTLALPTTSSFGDNIFIVGKGSGGWTIAQAASQQIFIGSSGTTIGAGGSVSSTNAHDSCHLVCTVANTTWSTVSGVQGNLTIV